MITHVELVVAAQDAINRLYRDPTVSPEVTKRALRAVAETIEIMIYSLDKEITDAILENEGEIP